MKIYRGIKRSKMKRIKDENKILIMLAFFSISIGLWENFRQLWMQDNNFSATQISNMLSIGTLISVIGVALFGKYIKLDKLKNSLTWILIIKFINMLLLYNLNGTNQEAIIKTSIVVDIIMGYIIITSIYPLITSIVKSDTVFSKRKLTEYLFKDIGILFGGLFIGKSIAGKLIDYNACLIISNIFLVMSIITMMSIRLSHKENKQPIKKSLLNDILKDKILIIYLLYYFIGSTAMKTALGLKMLTLTNYFSFSDSIATNYLLIVGLVADGIGILALKYLTPKNDYITITIKFGIRFMWYVIAFISNDITVTLIAITWSLLISTAYENICDGVYINRIKSEQQLAFSNVRYVVKLFAEAIGVFLCGIMYGLGLRYMFGLSAIFMILQIGLAYYLIHLRRLEKTNNRITLISFIDERETSKIENIMSTVNEKNCKVPYGINDKKRYEIDNLPYHFTIFATNKENQSELLEIVESIEFDKIQLKIDDVKIMKAKNESYCLYLSIEENSQIKELQRIFYNKFPQEKYNPDNFVFHMTLHIDKDFNKILKLQKVLKENFEPFMIEFDTLALFDYPGEMIRKIELKEKQYI